MKDPLNLLRAASELPLPDSRQPRPSDQIADPLPTGEVVVRELTGADLDGALRDEFDRLLNLRTTPEGQRHG